MKQLKISVCTWIGKGEGCRHTTIYSKSYCEDHYGRVYFKMFTEMANYVLDKEVELVLQNSI